MLFNFYYITQFIISLKSTRNGAILLMSNLSTSVFRLAKFAFSAKFEASTCVTCFRSAFVA